MANVHAIKIADAYHWVGKTSMGKDVADNLHSHARVAPATEDEGY